jgi:hypothetical protein
MLVDNWLLTRKDESVGEKTITHECLCYEMNMYSVYLWDNCIVFENFTRFDGPKLSLLAVR